MKALLAILRKLSLGVGLIVAAGGVLLLSDPGAKKPAANKTLKVALANFSSTVTLEQGQQGLLDGLAEQGFIDGQNMKVTRYNAETDRATAVAIAKDVVSRDFDLILTVSTVMLQSVANANKETERTHVFAITTDPWGAGIGVSRENPSDHPPYMTGYGSLQPVAELFRLAREANPGLKSVGVVWNPSESNSEASTVMARQICKELGIELVEVTVDSPAGVGEAANAVVARGVEVIWAGGDVTVGVAFDSLVAAANSRQIPVFANMPDYAQNGALFALGANYHEIGRVCGHLAAKILRGASPASIPVENFLPEQLALNTATLKKINPEWKFPSEWLDRADIVVDEGGVRKKSR